VSIENIMPPSVQREIDASFIFGFKRKQLEVFNVNTSKGWHESQDRGPSSVDKKLSKQMLIVSEVAEMTEACRKPMKPSEKIPEFTCEEEELADVVIRSMDYAEKEDLRLAEAVVAKLKYNSTRSHKHGGKLV